LGWVRAGRASLRLPYEPLTLSKLPRGHNNLGPRESDRGDCPGDSTQFRGSQQARRLEGGVTFRGGEGTERQDQAMQDIWMLVFTVVFFGLAFAYVQACHKLR